MNERILVTYATRNGSTAEVAQKIAQTLKEHDKRVDVFPIDEVADLSRYDAVIVGSAIRFGNWLPEAVTFVKENHTMLSHIPTAFFTVCMTLSKDTAENRQTVWAYLDPVRAILKPTHEGWFAGKQESRQLTWWEGLVAKAIKFPNGDYRDWSAIQSWAGQLF